MKYEMDYKNFWMENEKCFKPFSVEKPRVPLSFILEDHFIMHFLPMESVRYYADPAYTIEMNTKANDILEKEIGLRYYREDNIGYIKGAFEIIMGARRVIREGNTPWIEPAAESIEEVKTLIKKAEKLDIKRAIPDEWREQREKLMNAKGKKLMFGNSLNGPATVACNMLGTENVCMYIMDEPEIMNEYFEIMAIKYSEFYETVQMEDNGFVYKEGIAVNDDNCYLFPPKQYEEFCMPFLKKLFDKFAPLSHHKRRQHSDSNMGHLMRLLNDLGVNEVNLGPELHPLDIRKAMPKAIIYGQMPPFVLRNGTTEEIIEYVKRDIDSIGADGGLVESLAGVVPESTPLKNIRTYIQAVDKYGRY